MDNAFFSNRVNPYPSINLYWTQIKFPMQKLAIFRKVKEIKELRGGVQVVRRTSNSAD
jgi:hypothetical protein